MKLKINIYVINGSKNKLINDPEKKVSINKFYYINFLIFFELNYTINTIQICSQKYKHFIFYLL